MYGHAIIIIITYGSILLFFYWPEAIHVIFHFLTYWLAKNNFCAIKKHIAFSCKINERNYVARECNMVFYCTEISKIKKKIKMFIKFQKFHTISKFSKNSKMITFIKFQNVALLCVFAFWVPCCDVRYYFRIKTMFCSS